MNYLLGAFPPELGPWLKDPPQGWTAQLTGIGGMEAGLTVQALLQHHPGARVLFIGTCGAFDLEQYPLGTIVEIREATTRSL